MITFNKITEIFSIVDNFCKEFESETEYFLIGSKPKRPPRMSSAEVIIISLLFHLIVFRCFKHFNVFYVQKHMQRELPETVSYNRFTELMQRKLMLMSMFAKTCFLGSCTGISFAE